MAVEFWSRCHKESSHFSNQTKAIPGRRQARQRQYQCVAPDYPVHSSDRGPQPDPSAAWPLVHLRSQAESVMPQLPQIIWSSPPVSFMEICRRSNYWTSDIRPNSHPPGQASVWIGQLGGVRSSSQGLKLEDKEWALDITPLWSHAPNTVMPIARN